MQKITGFDSCIIGITKIPGDGQEVFVYSDEKIISFLQESENLSFTEALEWLEFNILRGQSQSGMPIVLEELTEDQLENYIADLGET